MAENNYLCTHKRNFLYTLYLYMALKIVVLAKQVPDTRNVGKDAMTAEGTGIAQPYLLSLIQKT